MESLGVNATSYLTGAVLLLFVIGLIIASAVFVYNDAERRGKSGCIVTIFTFIVSWPIGLLAWLVMRPEIVLEAKRKKKNDDLIRDAFEGDM